MRRRKNRVRLEIGPPPEGGLLPRAGLSSNRTRRGVLAPVKGTLVGTSCYPLSLAEKLTPRQAARRLGVTLSTVYRLIESGELAASKVGGRWVVYASAVEELLRRSFNITS